jgi:4-amino-4-deoxy-L-arabinose transferase-like glycosyltransferase
MSAMNSDTAAITLPWRPDFSRRSVINALPLVAICLLPILIYLPFAGTPFERDEGTYATVAQGILDGQVPYRDLFDNKPPLVYGWYALSFLLFGEHVAAPRIVASLLLSITTLALFAQARLLFPRGVAYLAATLFAVSTGVPFLALHANTEAYMLLPLVTSVAAFTVGMNSRRLGWFFLAGVLGALAIGTKQVAMWNLVALAVVALTWQWRTADGTRERFAPLLSLLSGAASGLAVIAIPFLATGSIDDLVYANVSYNWLYVGFLTWGERFLNLGSGTAYVFAAAAPLLVAGALGLFTILRRGKRAVDYLVIGWALASAVGVASGGRFFPHYFLHLVPAMALLAAIVIYERFARREMRLPSRPALMFGLLLVVVSLTTNAVLYVAPRGAEKQVAENVYYQKEWEDHSRDLGLYIKARTGPKDTIFNFGREPQIYFYADRRPAAQYFYDWAYQYDERTLVETVDVLRLERPSYILDSTLPPLFPPGPRPQVLIELLNEDYVYVGRLYFADIYRLKEDTAWPSELQPLMP